VIDLLSRQTTWKAGPQAVAPTAASGEPWEGLVRKLPYFEWYPADCDTDENVRGMDDRELGFYLRCLNHAWVNGSIPGDVRELARVLGRSIAYVRSVWGRVSRCFVVSEDADRLVSRRQEEQRQRAELISKRNANNVRTRYDKSTTVAESKGFGSTTHARAIGVGVSGSISSKFPEFWKLYVRIRSVGEDRAAQAWISLECDGRAQAVFDCLSSYLESRDVQNGAVMNGDKWLWENAKDGWKSRWPAAARDKTASLAPPPKVMTPEEEAEASAGTREFEEWAQRRGLAIPADTSGYLDLMERFQGER
jgi:hypothetical protein